MFNFSKTRSLPLPLLAAFTAALPNTDSPAISRASCDARDLQMLYVRVHFTFFLHMIMSNQSVEGNSVADGESKNCPKKNCSTLAH